MSSEVRRRVAITGAGGQLGRELVRAFAARGDEVLALSRPTFDITRSADLERLVDEDPAIVVNAAAWTDVDGCARAPERALAINGAAAGRLAAAAHRVGAFTVQVSTNEVFDGRLARPYAEADAVSPINAYGTSKLAGERAVAAATPHHLIVRTAWIYGGASSFPVKIRAAAARATGANQPLRVVADELGNPTPAADLADRIATLVDLRRADLPRIVHLAGEPPVSRYEWAARLLDAEGVRLERISQADYARPSVPPLRAVLSTELAADLGLEPIDWTRMPG